MTVTRPAIASPLIWSTASSLATQALSFLTFAILARLLGASAFGLVALAALVIDLLLVVSNAGINEAVVQRRTLTEEDADTAFWTNLCCGLLFCIATIAAAPLMAYLFGQPELTAIVTALATIFAITPLAAIHTARLTRDLKFRSVAMRNISAALAGAAVGLPMAFAGYGVWALVGQRIAAALAMVVTAWASLPWLPRLRFHRQSCAEMLRFGAYIGISGTLNQINIRSAEVISGALVGPVAVAFIRAGSRIVEVLNQITYMPFQQIAMPVLTRSTHDLDALKSTYLRLSRLSAFIMFPAFLGTLALAGEIVAIVFGDGWEPVADAIRIFACAVVASQMNNLIIAAITAMGQSRTVLSWTSTQIVVGVAAAVTVHGWGWQAMLITGVARGYLILPYGFHLLRKHADIHFVDVLASLRPAMASSVFMALVVILGVNACQGQLPPMAIVTIWLPAGAVFYFATYFWQDRTIIGQLRDMITARRARSATAG
ncbi:MULTISPECIES: lipopolysaccharide biosynthesis protein [unclassified Novosphingobium]|uniref:lipopolysaccharide biosynthesis protein n=1 Tax=unclassified Novosphingobium TaxID=2644732 RepID=UPI00135990FF|nr:MULTISPECIES: lipopolysaccharide biosynthesis protein [unclassified Novosphingobium]